MRAQRNLPVSLSILAMACAVALVAAPVQAVNGGVQETLKSIHQVAGAGPFRPSWESLAEFQVPEWYQDAKFGIFIHWGAYSVPGYGNEWYPREMYKADKSRRGIHEHHVNTYGKPSEFGYKDFIPMFKAQKFDPAEWARLFREAGAKYVIPVAEHHDGFPMYDSDYTEWSAAKMGPKRDVIGELAEAIRAEGLTFGLSSHRVENWWFYGEGRKIESDVTDERYRGLYGPARDRKESEDGKTPPDEPFLTDWLLRCCELVDKYEPQVIWFDWWIAQPAVHPYLKTFSAYYYNRGAQWKKGVAINYKKHGGESFPDTAGVLDIERGQLAAMRDLFWQTDTSVSKTSWGYVTNHEYKTANSLIDDLIDIVSKNGCMLLNIGPKPDGTIPLEERRMLLNMGKWLTINGEAIYNTRPWQVFGEGPTEVVEGTFAEKKRKDFTAQDIRFTRSKSGDTVYAIILGWPANSRIVNIRSLAAGKGLDRIGAVTLLGHEGRLHVQRDTKSLSITLPARKPCDYAYVLKIVP